MTFSSLKQARAAKPASPPGVFVGLKIAPEIANKLAEFAAALKNPSARPVAAADIHLTLVPPWNEASIPDAIEKLGHIAERSSAFWLIFEHVGYGPQPRRPRLLWTDCAATEELGALHTALLQAFGQADERAFKPHVTLARIRVDGSAVARRHPIDQSLSLRQWVETIELFQSPPPSATGYRVLTSLRLGQTPGSTRSA
jgi:RNA 2',3'-cyclic 3'-phosphodiesterase